MPDADGFDHPGLSRRGDAPARWTDAFAALPQESPAPSGWQRLQARLPVADAAPPRRARWPAWGALAASLALAVAIPLQRPPAAVAPAPAVPASAQAPAPTAAHAVPAIAAASGPDEPPPLAAERPASTTPATARQPARTPRAAPVQPAIRTLAPAAGAPMLADARDPLDALQGQSAQLENLLALARDERVSSGTSAALSSELDAQLAGIDAALIQPGLDAAQRTALWGERVDALQQLVGIETTHRLYAARGQSFDVALVSID
jgi:hypothetical protein